MSSNEWRVIGLDLCLFDLDDVALRLCNVLLDVVDVGFEAFDLVIQLADIALFLAAHQGAVTDAQRLRQRSSQLVAIGHPSAHFKTQISYQVPWEIERRKSLINFQRSASSGSFHFRNNPIWFSINRNKPIIHGQIWIFFFTTSRDSNELFHF